MADYRIKTFASFNNRQGNGLKNAGMADADIQLSRRMHRRGAGHAEEARLLGDRRPGHRFVASPFLRALRPCGAFISLISNREAHAGFARLPRNNSAA